MRTVLIRLDDEMRRPIHPLRTPRFGREYHSSGPIDLHP